MADRTGQIRHSIGVAGGLSIENCQRAYFKSQEAREAMLMNNQTTMAPTTPMMLTSSSSDFGLDFLSQNDSFNKSLEIDLSVLNDIGVDFHLIFKQGNIFFEGNVIFLPRFLSTFPKYQTSRYLGQLNHINLNR